VPELPDVEGFRRYFARYAAGGRVEKVEVLDRSLLCNTTPRGLGRALRGRRLARPGRHGKWLLVPTEGATLLVHFGMTGELRWTSGSKSRHPHDRVVLDLEGGELRYRNMRKFGGVWLGRTARDAWRIMGRPGPDALAVDRDAFLELLAGRRGAIKPALMDQKLIAGIGNELSDEILWQARLHPRRAIPNLATREQDQLFDALHDVLRESVRRGASPADRDGSRRSAPNATQHVPGAGRGSSALASADVRRTGVHGVNAPGAGAVGETDLALDDPDGPQPRHPACQARALDDVDHPLDVLVGERRFLGEPLVRG
jgi:formamidopyrimidine-DNA glycosylase